MQTKKFRKNLTDKENHSNPVKVVTFIFWLFLFCFVPVHVAAQQFIGPIPYSSFDNPLSGTNTSPFSSSQFSYFHLEDFEDGLLNSPGVSVREFVTTDINTAFSDSVDGDDGTIDGQATGDSTSLFSDLRTSSFTFDFDRNILNSYPTHAGIVWTDIGRNNGGTPFASDLIDNTFFEAFDSAGLSVGVVGPVSLGDSVINRTTDEDRFFGVIHSSGISAIKISMPGKNNWEVDHLQYGELAFDQNCNGLPVTVFIGNGDTPTSNSEVIMGTVGNDVINGLGGDDTICGLAGNDTINAGNGNDWVDAGPGNDTVSGDNGNDEIYGDSGVDIINGGPGNDELHGEDDGDFINGNSGGDLLVGGIGADVIRGGLGFDTIFGNRGQDLIYGGVGNDTIFGGNGDDELFGEAGVDELNGGSGDDMLNGGDDPDGIGGGDGADTIFTGSGATVGTSLVVSGGPGPDVITGGPDADFITGNAGRDTVNGGAGSDVIDGGIGNDNLFGQGGSDTISGGMGDDTIIGGFDNDDLNGGNGNDFLVGGFGSADVCNGGNGAGDTAAASCEAVSNVP